MRNTDRIAEGDVAHPAGQDGAKAVQDLHRSSAC